MSDSPITDPLAWRPVKAPSLLDLEILAGAVFAGLPEKFRALCEGLVIRVEDFADDDVLDDMEIDDPFALMGLFQGVGLPFQSDSAPVQMPNMVWLYPAADPRLLGRARRDAGLHRHPRAGARDRPPFRPFR